MSTSFPPAFRPSSAERLQPEASGNVAMNPGSGATDAPLDLLLVTSRIDFDRTCCRFVEDGAGAGLNVAIIYLEDLAGENNGERLDDLLQLNAQWQSSGKICSSTIKVVLLHGGTDELPADPGIDQFRQKYFGGKDDVAPSSRDGGHRPSHRAPAHAMSARADSMMFPTELIDVALRLPGTDGNHGAAGFPGTIVMGSCKSGSFRQAAMKTGGDYVLGTGKKSAYLDDFEAGLFAILDQAAARKRQRLAPLSGRDCWMLLRNVSGEHVSYVGDSKLEISKLLESGHSEPAWVTSGGGITAQAIRLLFAKIKHGSAASVRKVIDTWGPEILASDHAAVMPRVSLLPEAMASLRDGEQKVRLLMDHLPGFITNEAMVLNCLDGCIRHRWTSILADLFGRMAAQVPPLSLESFVIWLKSAPDTQHALVKLCRGSRPLTDALGLYMLNAMNDDAQRNAHRLFVIPEFFKKLAERTYRKMQQSRQQ